MFGLGGDKQVISLDWDMHSLRVVQWRMSRRRAWALKSVTARLGDDVVVKDAESMGNFVQQVLSEERIRTQSVIVDIPRDQAVLNSMSLPAVDLNDLAGMVQLQIAKELSFPLGDAVVDFAVTEHDGEANTADVLVAAVRCEVLDFYKSVCEQAGLKLERVGLRPYANMVAVNEMLGSQTPGRVMFVDVGPALTEIGILRDGVLVFSRAASVLLDEEHGDSVDGYLGTLPEDKPGAEGAEDKIQIESPGLEQVEPQPSRESLIVDSLMVEITRSAEAYRSTDPGARFDHIIVGGSSELEEQLAAKVSKRFGVPAETYNPEPLLNAEKHRGGSITAFAAAVGLGVGHAAEDKLQFNFLAPKKPLGAAARRRKQLPLAGAVVAGVAVVAAAAYYFGIVPKHERIAELQTEIATLNKEVDRYEEVSRIVKQVEQWEQAQLVWPDELMQLSEAFPDNEEAYLQDLDMNASKGEISFTIRAKSRAVINNLATSLNELTRPGRKKDEKREVFKVSPPKIGSKERDEQYPWNSKMTIKSARIDESQSKNKKGRKKN